MTPMMEARAIKSPDEIKAFPIVGVDLRLAPLPDRELHQARHDREPGRGLRVRAALLDPGHGGRRGRHRLVRTQRVAELAQLLRPDHPPGRARDRRPRGAHLERLQVVLLPDLLRRRQADRRAPEDVTTPRTSGCGTRSRRSSPGVTTADIASKWPSAKEAWGYEEEDQAAANNWGHGLGLAQYDPPVISRIWSLDHPGRDPSRA